MKKGLKITLSVLGIIAAIIVAAIVIANIVRRFQYTEYYKIMNRVSKNPGMNSGFICQGVTYNDDEDYYVTLGYMKNGSASRVYKIDSKKNVTYYSLKAEGKDFTGHTGGIQYFNGKFYIANESDGIYQFPSSALLKKSDFVEIGTPKKVNNNSSFIFADDDYLYVGEFNNDKAYKTNNQITYKDKTQNAIVTKYKGDDFSKPVSIYSIPNEIQGFAISSSGKVVLSRSWGLSSSDFFVFDNPEKTNLKYDGAPVYFLDNYSKDIKAPFFSEDLDVANGKIIYLSESACNKYIVGKFYFDYYIYSLNIE